MNAHPMFIVRAAKLNTSKVNPPRRTSADDRA